MQGEKFMMKMVKIAVAGAAAAGLLGLRLLVRRSRLRRR